MTDSASSKNSFPPLPTTTSATSGGGLSPLVQRRLGDETVSDKLSLRHSRWLHDSIFLTSADPNSDRGFVHDSIKQTACRSRERGSVINAGEGRHRGGSPLPRLLQPPICGTQKGRWLEASDKPEKDQQTISHSPSLPHGHYEGRGRSSPPGGLGRLSRSKRRLLPHPPQSPVAPLPPLRLEKASLPISCATFRPFDRPVYIHDGDETGGGLPSIPRDSSSVLPGRYSDNRKIAGGVQRQSESCSRASSISRVPDQLEEIELGAESALPLPRSPLEYSFRSDRPPSTQTGSYTSSFPPHAAKDSNMPLPSDPPRSHDRGNPGNSSHSPPRSPSPVGFDGGLRIDSRQQVPSQSFGEIKREHLLESIFGSSPLQSPDVASLSGSMRPRCIDGCVESRLGNSFRGSSPSRDVGCGCPSPYQCEGALHAADLPE